MKKDKFFNVRGIPTTNLRNLTTRQPKIFEKYTKQVLDNTTKHIIPFSKWAQAIFPVNWGKTQLMYDIFYHFIQKEKYRLQFITSRQTNTISQNKLTKEHESFRRKVDYKVVDSFVCTSLSDIKSIIFRLKNDSELSGVITCTTSFFTNHAEEIKTLIEQAGFSNKVIWHDDESVSGASSSHETTDGNNGNKQDEERYKASKFKAFQKIKNHFLCIGYTGNQIEEHHNPQFGTDEYYVVNHFPTKDEIWTMNSAARTPITFDSKQPMENNLSIAFDHMFKMQQEQDIHLREKGLNDIGIKHCTYIQLAHGNSKRNNLSELKTSLPNLKVKDEWVGTHAAITTFEHGIEVFKFEKNGVVKMDGKEMYQFNYFDDDSLFDEYNSDLSPLRILFVIEKGIRGGNYPKITTKISFRSYNTKGITNWEEQVDGRGKRPSRLMEEISEAVSNCKSPFYNSDVMKKILFITTWYRLNTYQPFIPADSQYVDMYKKNENRFYYAHEVIGLMNEMEW